MTVCVQRSPLQAPGHLGRFPHVRGGVGPALSPIAVLCVLCSGGSWGNSGGPSWPRGRGGVSCLDLVTPPGHTLGGISSCRLGQLLTTQDTGRPALSWAQEGRPSWSCPRGAQGWGSGLHRDPDLGRR